MATFKSLYIVGVLVLTVYATLVYGQDENRGDGTQWKRCYQCYHERRNEYDASYDFNIQYNYMRRTVDGASYIGIPMNVYCTPNRTYTVNGVLQDYLPSKLEKTCSRDWYCVKELVELNYRNYFVARYCRQQCRERYKTLADGTRLIRECCEDDLCNNTRDVTASRVNVVAMSTVVWFMTSTLRKLMT